jgi:GAF domain-containing protein
LLLKLPHLSTGLKDYMDIYRDNSRDEEFERQILEAENRIAKAISSLFDLEETLHDVCYEVKKELGFDFVGISLVLLAQNVIEAVYGTGIAEDWANRARHYLENEEELRDIQADIVKTARTEVISGWDNRFDKWIYETFKHEKINRIYTPILLVRDGSGKVLDEWFQDFDWNENFKPRQGSNEERNIVIDINIPPELGSYKVIGTIEAGYQNGSTAISYEKAVELAKLAARHALNIRKTRLRCVLELIAENARQILNADIVTLHFLLDSHQDCYIYQVRSGTINNCVPETFPARLNKQGIGWQSIKEGCPKFIKSNNNSFNPAAFKEGVKSYAAFPLIIDRNKQRVIHQTATASIASQGGSNQEEFEPVVGVIYVHYKDDHDFTEDEIHRGEFLAERAVDAILHAMTYQQVRDNARQLAALHSVTQSISQIPENAELLSHIAWNTLNVLAADVVTIYAYLQTEEKFVTPPVIAGRLKKVQEMRDVIHKGEIPFVMVERGKSIYASNISENEIFKNSPFVKREGIESVVGVLLKVDEDVVGIMFINYRRRHIFPKQEKQIIETLAAAAAAAIKNQRWLQTLSIIDREIITTLEPDKLLDLIVERAVRITGAELGVVRLLDPINQCLTAKAIYPENEPVNQQWKHIKIGQGVGGKVAQQRRPEIIDNVQSQDDYYLPYFSGTMSELCVPLLGKDKDNEAVGVIGILNVESRSRFKAFNQRDLQKLELLADLAVIAIQNSENKEKLTNMEVMATLGDITSQLLHRIGSDFGALKVYLQELTDSIPRHRFQDLININTPDMIQDLKERIDHNLNRLKGWKQEDPICLRINQIIDDALKQVQINPPIELEKSLPSDLPEVLGGKQQLVGIFDNIIQNAKDAMNGSGTLSIRGSRIEGLDWVEIKVSDTGKGIPAENIQQIFERGFTTRSDRGNMGFGLWWTKIQVENLGGKISVTSELDQGTQFAVILPICKKSS